MAIANKTRYQKLSKIEKHRARKLKNALERAEKEGVNDQADALKAQLDEMDIEMDEISDEEEPDEKHPATSEKQSSFNSDPPMFFKEEDDNDPDIISIACNFGHLNINTENATPEGSIKYRGRLIRIWRDKETGKYSAEETYETNGGDEVPLTEKRLSLKSALRPRFIAAVVTLPGRGVWPLVPKYKEKQKTKADGTVTSDIVEQYDGWSQIKLKYYTKKPIHRAEDGQTRTRFSGASWESPSSMENRWGKAKQVLKEDIIYGGDLLVQKGSHMRKARLDALWAYILTHPVDGFTSKPPDYAESTDAGKSNFNKQEKHANFFGKASSSNPTKQGNSATSSGEARPNPTEHSSSAASSGEANRPNPTKPGSPADSDDPSFMRRSPSAPSEQERQSSEPDVKSEKSG